MIGNHPFVNHYKLEKGDCKSEKISLEALGISRETLGRALVWC